MFYVYEWSITEGQPYNRLATRMRARLAGHLYSVPLAGVAILTGPVVYEDETSVTEEMIAEVERLSKATPMAADARDEETLKQGLRQDLDGAVGGGRGGLRREQAVPAAQRDLGSVVPTMSELTDKARTLAQNASSAALDDPTIGILAQAIELLCDELEAHQHTYWGPIGLAGKWATTQVQRDTLSASQKIFEQQAAAKVTKKGT